MPLSVEQEEEIGAQREVLNETRRAVSPTLEGILYQAMPVLDHGFVRVIDYMGNDEAIVQAARVSYGRGTKTMRSDSGLIRYLLKNKHTTPFEMCEIKFHVKLPIFVARQWIRHRTASINEYSARYSVLENEFYIPAPENLAAQSVNNRQGRGAVLTGKEAEKVHSLLLRNSEEAFADYLDMLNEDEEGGKVDSNRDGLARELARMNLSLNFYTQWYWKTDLHNLMHFLSLRVDSHAQYEIRVYAEIMLDILQQWVPQTFEAFTKYRIGGIHLSSQALEVVKGLISGSEITQPVSGLSQREWRELMEALGVEHPSD